MALVTIGAGTVSGQQADSTRRPVRPWLPPLASLIVPGSGQLIGGRDRGLIYLAAEAVVLSRVLQLFHNAHRGADQYRSLAYTVARRGFTTTRRDTVFEYYETMERFTTSGEYDRDPGPGLEPESDPTTYNGSVWLLARRTFWTDPDVQPAPTDTTYLAAIEFYRDHAVGQDFRWSWHGAPLEHQEFRATIRSSDNAFRKAQGQLGLLLANHLASAIDALISSRLSAGLRRPTTLETLWGGRAGSRIRLTIAF